MTDRYIGSGPYCYANSLAMVLADGTDPGLIEVLTGSPFGMQLLGGRIALFDPLGWDPGIGIDVALGLLGLTSERTDGGDGAEAVDRLRSAVAAGPVLVGPMDIGLLLHHPEAHGAIGSDHYVVVLGVEDDWVVFHDPHGYPYATMPTEPFATAWRGDSIPYTDAEFTMRSGFRSVDRIAPLDALRASLSAAAAWLDGRPEHAPPGSLGATDAALALADLAEAGMDAGIREVLTWFAVRLGARRLADASYWLAEIELAQAAAITAEQSRLVGSLQYPLVAGDRPVVVELLRQLAPTYQRLSEQLKE